MGMSAANETDVDTGRELTIVISPELRDLFRAHQSGMQSDIVLPSPDRAIASLDEAEDLQKAAPTDLDADPGHEPEHPPSAEPCDDGLAEAVEDPVYRKVPDCVSICLRRDGGRPLVFKGTKLVSGRMDCKDPTLRLAFNAYLTEDGGVAAAMALTAPDAVDQSDAIRPIYVAEMVTGNAELETLLNRFDPALAFPVSAAFSDPAAESALPDLIRRTSELRRQMHQLAKAALTAGPC